MDSERENHRPQMKDLRSAGAGPARIGVAAELEEGEVADRAYESGCEAAPCRALEAFQHLTAVKYQPAECEEEAE